jgi:anti-sigma factor RsiW
MNARAMDHEQAIKNMVAERYLLGELSENERDAYEEHLFNCQECFEQVKAGTEFVSYLRRLGTEEPVAAATQPRWRQFLAQMSRPAPAFAFAMMFLCIAGISVYQSTVIHRMKTPQVVAVVTIPPEARGVYKMVTAPRNGTFELRVLFQPRPEFRSYTARVVNASGKEIASIALGEAQTGELQIRFNAGTFQSGKYTLTIQGIGPDQGSVSVSRYLFELRLQD